MQYRSAAGSGRNKDHERRIGCNKDHERRIGAIDIMKPSRANHVRWTGSLMRVLSLMRLSLGGGAGLAIGAARALGAAEDGSRDGGRSIRRRPRAQRAPCLP